MEGKEIIIGRNPVFEYIKNCNDTIELYVAENAHGKIIDAIVDEAHKKKIQIFYKDKNFFSQISASSKHQGVAIKISRKNNQIDENHLLIKVREKKGILMLLDQLTDPHNVGSIIRTTEALGGDGIIIPKSNAVQINSTVVKSSAGATAYIDIIHVSNVASFLEKAKKHDFWIIGTSDKGNTEIAKIKDTRPLIIIIGNEGKGIRHLTEEKCDFIVNIPLKGKISSLNASVAAGIILYEFIKSETIPQS